MNKSALTVSISAGLLATTLSLSFPTPASAQLDEFVFSGPAGGPISPASQTLVTLAGVDCSEHPEIVGQFTYSITADQPWLTISNPTGDWVCGPQTTIQLSVSAGQTASLAQGSHTSTVTAVFNFADIDLPPEIQLPDTQQFSVPVQLTITESTDPTDPTDPDPTDPTDPTDPISEVIEQIDQFATSAGQSSMATVIGTVCPAGVVSAELQRDCNAIVNAAFANDADTSTALAAVTPDQVSAPADASLNSIALQSGIVAGRLATLRTGSANPLSFNGLSIDAGGTVISGRQMQSMLEAMTGGSAGDGMADGFSRLGIFVSGRISRGDRDTTDNVTGFDYDIQGLTLGADYRLDDRTIVGGAIGYSNSDATLNADRGQLDADSYAFTLYGSRYLSDQLFIDGSLTYGRGDYDQQRRVRYALADADVDQSFASSFDGKQLGLALNAGYEIRSGALTLIPTGRLQYIDADLDGYREESVSNPDNDGSGLAVEIDDQSYTSFTLSLGGQVNYAIGQSWGVLLPFVSAEWVHEFRDNESAVSGRFIGDPTGTNFVLPVDGNDKNYFDAGIGVSAQFTNGAAGFLSYQRILGYDDLDHYTFNAGLRFEF